MWSPGSRRQLLVGLTGLVVAGLVTGCSLFDSSDEDAVDLYPPTSAGTSSTAAPTTTGAPAATAPTTTTEPPPPPLPAYQTPRGERVAVQPSGFVVTKVPAGERPPQFVVTSFDGVGWREKWDFWRGLQQEVPLRFTGFLTGTYLLSEATRDIYVGPGRAPGASSLSWTTPDEVRLQVEDLNEALRRGDEIGTHFNGHFCSGVTSPVGSWTTADWNNEMDQFNGLIDHVETNNGLAVQLDLETTDIIGSRTPCLEGDPAQMYPAFVVHGIRYDSSPARTGIAWPTKVAGFDLWNIAMALFPMHGTDRPLITMDYNFYARQRNATSEGVTPEQSKLDSDVVLNTYRDMYRAASEGNRAPLILGNHFNRWNNNAYTEALATFLRESCIKPETYCIPFRDLVAWMEAQDPQVLAGLQALPPETDAVPNAPAG